MNPSTGTFISMDSYQGSIYDPVTLHKYLYANANLVMYTDPSGYSAEDMVAIEGNLILSSGWIQSESTQFIIGMNAVKQLWALQTVETISYVSVEVILTIIIYDILENPMYDSVIELVAEMLNDALGNIDEICENAKVNNGTINYKIKEALKYIKGNEDQPSNDDGKWHYKKGRKRPPKGSKLVRSERRNVKSEDFKEFIRSLGQNFKSSEWKKVMQTYETPSGQKVEIHYWLNTTTGETWMH